MCGKRTSYRVEKRATMKIALPDADAEIGPVPTDGGGRKPEPELDRLSNILKTFNDQFGNIDWKDADKIRQVIAEEMASFIGWIAPRYEVVRDRLNLRTRELQHAMQGAHGRVAENLASLAAGFEEWLRFATECDAITFGEAEQLWERFWNACRTLLRQQEERQADENPIEAVLRLLDAAHESGSVYLKDEDSGDQQPSGAHHIGSIDSETGDWLCVENDLYSVARKLYDQDDGNSLPRKRTFFERLVEGGYSEPGEDDRMTVRRTIEGEQRRVIVIKASAFERILDRSESAPTFDTPLLSLRVPATKSQQNDGPGADRAPSPASVQKVQLDRFRKGETFTHTATPDESTALSQQQTNLFINSGLTGLTGQEAT